KLRGLIAIATALFDFVPITDTAVTSGIGVELLSETFDLFGNFDALFVHRAQLYLRGQFAIAVCRLVCRLAPKHRRDQQQQGSNSEMGYATLHTHAEPSSPRVRIAVTAVPLSP